ncbi:MAG: hypothetical protein M0P34_14885, partial [Desulfocurvus sp.]|nr:hypothetical protein [Desulfocurvus sp.]
MNARSACRLACLFVLTGLAALVLAAPALGVVYSFGRHPDKERLVLQFPAGLPEYTLARSAPRALALRLPGGGDAAGALPDVAGARLVSGLRVVPGGLDVELSTPEAGFVAFTLDNPPRLVVDVFSDPLGARWKPEGPAPRRETPAPPPGSAAPAPPAPAAPRPAPPVATQDLPDPAPPAATQTSPAPAPPAPQAATPAVPPVPAPQASPSATPAAPAAPAPQASPSPAPTPPAVQDGQDGQMRTFFEVPYVFRGRVTPPGQAAPAQAERVPDPGAPASAPAPPDPGAPASGPAPASAAPGEPGAAAQAVPVPGKPGTFSVSGRVPAAGQAVGAVPGAEVPADTDRP